MMDGYGMSAGAWIAMTLVWIVLLALIVVALVRLFPNQAPPARHDEPPSRDTPLEILDRRLASGGLTFDEYDRLRERLVDAARGR